MYAIRKRPGATRKTREAVMSAVRSLLEEGVFHESAVEAVAARAGVSRATLYTHFGTRLGLVDAMCETFDENPALVAIRQTDDMDEFIELVVDFWSAEEKVLVQLYGAAAIDPAAGALVGRQHRDRQNELKRLLRARRVEDRTVFAQLCVLTSFETYRELRRNAGLPKREVVSMLQRAAGRALKT